MDTEDEPFSPHRIWNYTWCRLEKKALSLQEKVKENIRRADSRADKPPELDGREAPLAPIAKGLTENGEIIWDEEIVNAIKALGKKAD